MATKEKGEKKGEKWGEEQKKKMDEGTKCGESLASVNYEIWRTRRRVIEKRKKDEKERKNGVNM